MASFPKQLRELDPDLNIKWNPDIQRFTIHQKTCNPILPNPVVWKVQGEDGSFRHPDMRDLQALRLGNIEKEGPKEKMRRIAGYMIDEREKDRKRATDNIHHAGRENKIQLVNAVTKAANTGKGNSAFRRIRDKVKGKVY